MMFILTRWEAGALPQQLWGLSQEVIIDIDESDEGTIIASTLNMPVPMRVHWTCAGCKVPLKPGRWSAQAILKPLQSYANPGAHDFLATRMRSGVRASAKIIHPLLKEEAPPRAGFSYARQSLSDFIRKGPYEFKPLLLGLVLGDKSLMGKKDWEVLRNTGTAHLLAISGLHLTIVATAIYTIIFWLIRLLLFSYPGLPAKPIAWLLACLLSYPYIVFTGDQISAWRAYLMLGCISLVVLGRRSGLQFQDLAIVAAGVILLQPDAVGSMSLWLSVGAIGLILLIGPQLDAMPRLYRSLIMQWRLSIGLGLLACMMMHTFSLTSPLANICAIPYVSLIVVPLCFVATLVYTLYPAGAGFILKGADMSLQGLWWWLEGLSSLSAAPILWITTPWQWISACLLLILCLLPSTRHCRVISFVSWIGVLCPIPPHPTLGEVWIDVLDVGQGLAVVVRTQKHTLVYDTGAGFGDRAVAELTLLPFLYHEHIKQIDTVMISHSDNDHRGGYATLKALMPITRTLSGEPQERSEQPCHAGQHWNWEDIEFTVISPGPVMMSGHNNRSCVLKIGTGMHAVLLTGDIEQPIEKELENDIQLHADVLLVPHHGSKTSSSVAFLRQVRPEHAIISAGLMNRYQHPHEEIVKRYESQGIKLWNTAQSGAMHVKISRSGVKLSGYKENRT